MHVLALVGNKGGTGKSTLSRHLAVAGVLEGKTVLLLDADMQQSAAETWSRVRGKDAPTVSQVTPETLEAMLKVAEEEGVDLVVIDTPPASGRSSLIAIKAADIVLLPLRPSLDDLAPLTITKELLELPPGYMHKAVAVLNAVPPKGEALAEEAEEALESLGFKVAPVRIGARNSFLHAANEGSTVQESDPRDKGALEIGKLWAFVGEQFKKGDVNEQGAKAGRNAGTRKASGRAPA